MTNQPFDPFDLVIRDAKLPGAQRTFDIACRGGEVACVGTDLPAESIRGSAEVVHAEGRVVLPGFVDCHTHACWAGCRLDEWEQCLAGVSYLEVLANGGGIMSTVRAVRDATQHELTDLLLRRLALCLRHGTTTIEVKSGYGLTAQSELKMLGAIADASERWPGTIVPTACIGHAKDPDQIDPVRQTIEEILPAVTASFPGIAVDAYCETGAWSLDECLQLFDAALNAGHPVRVHADQFHDLGMIPEAIRRGFRSVDHLEATEPEHLRLLAESDIFGVMLPASGFHLDDRYADGRAFVDAGGCLAIATNLNPGSSPCCSVPTAMALAVRKLGLSPAEALDAATLEPARLLGFGDRGTIKPGSRADLVLLSTDDERDLSYFVGPNLVEHTWIAAARV